MGYLFDYIRLGKKVIGVDQTKKEVLSVYVCVGLRLK